MENSGINDIYRNLNYASGNIASFIFTIVGNDNLFLLYHTQFRYRAMISSSFIPHESGTRDAVFSKVDFFDDTGRPTSSRVALVDHQNQVTDLDVTLICVPFSSFKEGWDYFSSPASPEMISEDLSIPPSLTRRRVWFMYDVDWETGVGSCQKEVIRR